MNLKRYRVNNIQEALQQIKKDLGPDAIIVSTRQVREGGSAFGLFGKTMLEVTAARDDKRAAKQEPAPQEKIAMSGLLSTAVCKPITLCFFPLKVTSLPTDFSDATA